MTQRNKEHRVFALVGMVVLVASARVLSFCGPQDSGVRVQHPGPAAAVKQGMQSVFYGSGNG